MDLALHRPTPGKSRAQGPRKRREQAPQYDWLADRREVQKRAVAALRLARRHNIPARDVARALGINSTTLQGWARAWEAHRLRFRPLGRPPVELAGDLELEIQSLLFMVTPFIGLDALCTLYPDVEPRALERLLWKTRALWTEESRPFLWSIRWQGVGRVWAIDFTQADIPIDGVFPYLLMVRDLASGMALLSLPLQDETSASVVAALTMLFAAVGAPLVLKSDNGSAFIDEATRKLLAAHQVISLLSPPGTPEYNGSVEVGGGTQKTWTHFFSTLNGRPDAPTSDDVEGAKLRNNELGKPWGPGSPAPKAAWETRVPISRDERTRLEAEVERITRGITRDKVVDGKKINRTLNERDLKRIAVSQALKELGYFSAERRRLSQGNRLARRWGN
jgi:transposase InsO family protein